MTVGWTKPISSELSWQSFVPSHWKLWGTHCRRSEHLNSVGWHRSPGLRFPENASLFQNWTKMRVLGTAVLLVWTVAAVVVAVTEPHLLDTFMILASELVRLAVALCGAVLKRVLSENTSWQDKNHFVGAVPAVRLSVTDVVYLHAFVISARLLVALAAGTRAVTQIILLLLELLWSIWDPNFSHIVHNN